MENSTDNDIDEIKPVRDEDQEADWEALRRLMDTADGRRVLFWFLSFTGVYSSGFSGADTNFTNFNLGKRDVGLRLIGELNCIDERFYPQLLLKVADDREMEKAAKRKNEEK